MEIFNNINENIKNALYSANINEPTPIQALSIPVLLDGNDVIGQAQTGTGKTFAYAIPIIEKMNYKSKNIEALILCPTRELSIQVSNEIKKLTKYIKDIRVCTIYGGQSYDIQLKELKKKPQIVIGTPGRIIDQMNKGNIDFSNIKNLVLDEADEMLKMGFQEDLETILKTIPNNRQTALFSATLPDFITKISNKYMNNPKIIRIPTKSLTVDLIDQQVYYCKKDSKKYLVVRLLDYNQFKCVMIFTNTKAMVDELVLFLQSQGFRVDGLHGDLKQSIRDRVMNSFRNSNVDILIATDVAARGIDVSGVDCVINYDVPNENEIYVHRIGRTARAGESGTAITISTAKTKGRIAELEKYTKHEIAEHQIPTVKEINNSFQKKLYLSILDKIDKYKDDTEYDTMLAKLARNNSDPMPLLRALMKMIDAGDKREYPEIEVLSKKGSSKYRQNDYTPSKNRYFTIELNLGSRDNVKPNQLVVFLHDELKVHREHFGKIIIKEKKSYIEVNNVAIRFFKENKKLKFNNRNVIYKIINN
ncbi:MAG: DEAD/DEAH box helicase [Anaeroplasma sp.]